MVRADSRCLTPVQTEQVGDQSVALWKGVPEPEEVSMDAARAVAITVVSVSAVLALSRWMLTRIAVGDYLPTQIFAIVVMASPFVVFALLLYRDYQKKRKAEVEPIVPSCVEFPRAVPVRVSLSNGQTSRGGSYGWLSIADGLLNFHGEYFDFALRPEDFRKPKDLLAQVANHGAAVVTPAGVSPQHMRIRFLVREEDKWVENPAGKDRIARDFESWQPGRATRPVLFPPLRSSNTPVRVRGIVATFSLVGLFLGIVVWQLPAILGASFLADRNMFGAGLGTFGLMSLMSLQLAVVGTGRNQLNREVDKARGVERKGVATRSE